MLYILMREGKILGVYFDEDDANAAYQILREEGHDIKFIDKLEVPVNELNTAGW